MRRGQREKIPIIRERPIRWLPVDSRLFPKVLRFGRVNGISRIFLELELTLSILVVCLTFLVAAIKIVLAVGAK